MDGIMKVGALGLAGGGDVRVGIGEDDMGDGMQCRDHPYRNNPGGICAFCLKEKLGKLVSSSFPLPIRGPSSSSSPPFRSDVAGGGGGGGGSGSANGVPVATSLSSIALRPTKVGTGTGQYEEQYTRRGRIPFLLAKKKKLVMESASDRNIVFKRSKPTTAPERSHFLDNEGEDLISPRTRGWFWSFLYISPSKPSSTTTATTKKTSSLTPSGSVVKTLESSTSTISKNVVVVEEDEESPKSQRTSSFGRNVSRSKSVGCGSRSFSGDFFERISTGFGDCTLRRVESQREGKPKVGRPSSGTMKERVKCGGIFGGFMITSSSSSSSSSSYWVSSSGDTQDMGNKQPPPPNVLAHGRSRSKSWSWAFASPMRAFTKDGKKDHFIFK